MTLRRNSLQCGREIDFRPAQERWVILGWLLRQVASGSFNSPIRVLSESRLPSEMRQVILPPASGTSCHPLGGSTFGFAIFEACGCCVSAL